MKGHEGIKEQNMEGNHKGDERINDRDQHCINKLLSSAKVEHASTADIELGLILASVISNTRNTCTTVVHVFLLTLAGNQLGLG